MKIRRTNFISDKKAAGKTSQVSALSLFKGITLFIVLTMVSIGCESIVDQETEADLGNESGEMATSFSEVHGSAIECINPNFNVYHVVSESITVEWGSKKNPFEKTVDIEYYNTLTGFVLRVKSSLPVAGVSVGNQSLSKGGGLVAAGTWQEFTLDLPADWQAGDVWSSSVRIKGSGPVAEIDVEYSLVGECIPACDDSVSFLYNGDEVSYGTVLGAGNRCWFDRNLGAAQVAVSSTDIQSYGDYFTHDEALAACPVGYRLATEAEWEAERLSWASNDAAGALASPLKLPMPGFRSSGSLISAGTGGVYWSSTTFETFARTLYFAADESYFFNGGRFAQRSVRCIQGN